MKKIFFLICVCMFISVFCGCMKASIEIPIDKPIEIKIESKDEKTPVIINSGEQTTQNNQ